MIVLASISVWVVRAQSLHELWFYIVQFGRSPSEIYSDSALGLAIKVMLLYIIPVMLAVNMPAKFAVKAIEWPMVIYTLVMAGVLLFLSRRFFYFALERYRSASS
jgi:ABC-2 type transport system permease protein